MDDQTIIGLFLQRSEQAIAATDQKYGNLCRRICMNLLRNAEDAQECVNDTWHSLWETIPPQRPDPLAAYIARIARNLAMKKLNYRNAAKRSAVIVSYEELSDCIPSGQDPASRMEAADLRRLINDFLDTLNPVNRNLFLRRYWFFDTVEQMAAGFGMSRSAVKTRLFRIRQELKDYLAKEADIYVG